MAADRPVVGRRKRTVEGDWTVARAWLRRELREREAGRMTRRPLHARATRAVPRAARLPAASAARPSGRRRRRRAAARRRSARSARTTADEPSPDAARVDSPPRRAHRAHGDASSRSAAAARAGFLAEQDEPIQRRVAIKVVPLAAASPELAARFEVERRALECTDHPNITRVLDAGRTPRACPTW
jgi:hypothetical protein